MIGAGVGVRILKSDVAEIPKVHGHYELVQREYLPVAKEERAEHTSLLF